MSFNGGHLGILINTESINFKDDHTSSLSNCCLASKKNQNLRKYEPYTKVMAILDF
jgi:hypothetical protein